MLQLIEIFCGKRTSSDLRRFGKTFSFMLSNQSFLDSFETEEACYFKGTWVADIPVLVRKEKVSGYLFINASHFCSPYGKANQYTNWERNNTSKDLIRYLTLSLNTPSTLSILTGMSKVWLGTYIHADLLPHLASWISPEIAIKVSIIVNMISKVKWNE